LYHTNTHVTLYLFFLTLIQVLYIDTTYVFYCKSYKSLRHSFWPVIFSNPSRFSSPSNSSGSSSLYLKSDYLNHLTNLNQPRLFGQSLEGMDLQQNLYSTQIALTLSYLSLSNHLNQLTIWTNRAIQVFWTFKAAFLELNIFFTFCRSKSYRL